MQNSSNHEKTVCQNKQLITPGLLQYTSSVDFSVCDSRSKFNTHKLSLGHIQNYQSDYIDSQHVNVILHVFKEFGKTGSRSDIGIDQFKKLDRKSYGKGPLAPEPIESQEELSKQAQYLGYLNPDKHESEDRSIASNSQIINQLASNCRNEYLSIFYQCAIYTRKGEYRSKIDDQLLADQFKERLVISLNPQPKDSVGSAILVNGYCLVAYSILMARMNASAVLVTYLLEQFKTSLMEVNQEQFAFYAKQSIDYFHIPATMHRRSSDSRQFKDVILKRQNINAGYSQPQIETELVTRKIINQQIQNHKEHINKLISTRATTKQEADSIPNDRSMTDTLNQGSPQC